MERRFKSYLTMRLLAMACISFLSVAAFGSIGPNTIMDEVPGSTTISNLVRVGETDPTVADWAKAGQPKPSGGADTNAVRAIVNDAFVGGTNAVNTALATYVGSTAATSIAHTVSRAMKPVKIGAYLWEIGTEGEDWTAATNRLAKAYPSYGRCTGVSNGRYHGRNLDWEYDRGCSIVVRSSAREGKYAVIGVADGAKKLTDDFMMSEAWDDTYISLPFTISDGMNEKGVVVQQNIIPTNTASATSAWRTKTAERCVISFAIVRYALDRCATAWEAANLIKNKIFVPSEFSYDFHYLVSDRTSSYVVEDNAIYPADVMTNFRVGGVQTNANGTVKWNTVEPFGIGVERYDRVRTNGFDKTTLHGIMATMKDVWYTKAYQPTTTPYWYTEFCQIGTDMTVMNALTNAAVFSGATASEYAIYTNEHDVASANYRGGHTWQTTHTAIFDKQDLTMRLLVQEDASSERLFYLKEHADHGFATTEYVDSSISNAPRGRVLHYYSAITNFIEATDVIEKYIVEQSPLYCIVDDYKWYALDLGHVYTNTPNPFYQLTFTCKIPGDLANSIYKPSVMSVLMCPNLGVMTIQFGNFPTLADNYAVLVANANFTNAVKKTVGTPSTDRITNAISVITAEGKLITRANTNAVAWTTNTLLSTASHAVTLKEDVDTGAYTVLDVTKQTGRFPTYSDGQYAFAVGDRSAANGNYSVAMGTRAYANGDYTFVWNGNKSEQWGCPDEGQFWINPVGGTAGFHIGSQSLSTILGGYVTTGRTVAGKSLSDDVTLGTLTFGSQTYNGSSDVSIDMSGYVPTSRTINGHTLASDVTITKESLGVDETKVWNTNGMAYISGDLGVYQKEIVSFTWTSGVSQATQVIPSYLVFSNTGTDAWTATKGSDTFTLSREDYEWPQTGEMRSAYTLLKNGASLPQNYSIIKNDASEMSMVGGAITLYKKVLGFATNRVDTLATQKDMSTIKENTNVVMRLDGSAFIVETNGVSVWRGESATVAGKKRYALFLLHLNPGSATHPFTDIELKGTTNNFYHVGALDSMTFYCASSVNGDPARGDNPEWAHDWCRIYILSSVVDSDVRKWRRIRNTGDLGTYQPRDLAILVDPALFRRSQGSDWCNDANDMLTWSYVRITATGPEMDEDGVHQLWRPIMPVRWYATLPGWANQDSWGSN